MTTDPKSATPRTEAKIAIWHSNPVQEQRDKAEDWARDLERELADCREELQRLKDEKK